MSQKCKCPNCGLIEFITEPNQYDVLEFSKNVFETITTETIDDYKIFCRECGKEVDILKSTKTIVLKYFVTKSKNQITGEKSFFIKSNKLSSYNNSIYLFCV